MFKGKLLMAAALCLTMGFTVSAPTIAQAKTKTSTVAKKKDDSKEEKNGNSCFKTVWAPSNKSAGGEYWSKVRADYVAKAPGGGDAVSFIQYPKGNRTYASGHRSANPNFPNYINEWRPTETWFNTTVARTTVQMFIPKDFKSQGGRLAFGIRGGQDPKGCLSGGCPPEKQTAFSVRVNYDGDLGGNLYSYHLDRHPSATTEAKAYGQGRGYSGELPVNQWITLVMDVDMGSPGKSDGFAKFTVYDAKGKLTNSAEFKNVKYRKNASWNKMGVIMTEKLQPSGAWGKAAPKVQQVYYRNWKMQVPCK